MWSRSIFAVVILACCVSISACLFLGEDDQSLPYRYVMIQDLGPSSDRAVRLNAVSLVKGTSYFYISNVEDAVFGANPPAVGDHDDFTDVLGPPEGDPNGCHSEYPYYVDMGGAGGFLIGSFGADVTIEAGDALVVHVCGSPAGTDGEYNVHVGVEHLDSAATWVPCVLDAVGTTTCTVPSLPVVSAAE